MCLLTFLPAGVLPDTDALRAGAELNQDGHGFAIIDNGQMIVDRGLDGPALIETFAAVRDRHRHGPALFHSRLATHGDTGIDNCHPFPVGGDPRTVIAHNGVLPKTVQPGLQDPRSDTRIAAEDFLPAFGPLRLRHTRRCLERWMTPHNLMVILTVDRRFRQQAYILNEPSGIWEGRIWYSNDGYLPPLYDHRHDQGWDEPWDRYDRHPADYHRGAYHRERCEYCHTVIDPFKGQCPICGWCPDCGQMPEDCCCYIPTGLDRRFDPWPNRPR